MQSPVFVTVPNLTEGQTAWQAASGDTLVVEIKQLNVNTPRGDELIGGPHVALRVRCWKVDPSTGEPVLDARQKALEIPAKVCTVLASALAEGTADLPNEIVQYTVDALERAQVWLAVKTQLDNIPAV